MNAVLSIELEILEPSLVESAEHLLQLHPSQIRWVSVRLSSDEGGGDSVAFDAQSGESRTAIRNLVALAQQSQPNGTVVRIWYQGRSESFVI